MNLLDLADDGDENAAIEAKILASGMGLTIEQIKAGITPNQALPAEAKENIPLLGEGGQVGGIPPAFAQMGNEPEEGRMALAGSAL